MTVISEAQIQKEELKNPKNNNLDYSISLWIDSYDDIFSDFDPRPFSARNISDDFLYEVKKTSFLSILLLTNIQRLELSSRGICCENDCEKICKKTAVIKILFILGFTNYDLSVSFSI